MTVDKQPYLELQVGDDVLAGATRTRVLPQSLLNAGPEGDLKAIVKCNVKTGRSTAHRPSNSFRRHSSSPCNQKPRQRLFGVCRR